MADHQDINDQLRGAAERGDIEVLYTLLRENPMIFDSMDNVRFVNTPLHIAASSSHHEGNGLSDDQKADASVRMAEFAVEMAIIMPSFTRKLNYDGLTPMHLALQHRNWKTVRALMTLDPELVRVKGKCGKTPLHVAAEIAPPQLLAELLYVCPSSIKDVTAQWKTAVHIAVEAENLESFSVLLGWLFSVGKEELLYSKDMDGNTVLHIATLTNQIQVVKRLSLHMRHSVKNFKGETALAIHQKNNGPGCTGKIGRILRSSNIVMVLLSLLWCPKPQPILGLGNFLGRSITFREMLFSKFVGMGIGKSREVVLVIAILVATATYEGVLNPPGGFWQDDSSSANTTASMITRNTTTAHFAGKMIMAGKGLGTYIVLNTIAFLISVTLIFTCVPIEAISSTYLFTCINLLQNTYQAAVRNILPTDYASLSDLVDILTYCAQGIGNFVLILRIMMARQTAIHLRLKSPQREPLLGLVICGEDANSRRNDQHVSFNGHVIDAEGVRGSEDP